MGGGGGGGGGGSKNLKRGGGGGPPSFHSSFGATKDTKQNFQLLMQCFKNTQQEYSITSTILLHFLVCCFSNNRYELKISCGVFIF